MPAPKLPAHVQEAVDRYQTSVGVKHAGVTSQQLAAYYADEQGRSNALACGSQNGAAASSSGNGASPSDGYADNHWAGCMGDEG